MDKGLRIPLIEKGLEFGELDGAAYRDRCHPVLIAPMTIVHADKLFLQKQRVGCPIIAKPIALRSARWLHGLVILKANPHGAGMAFAFRRFPSWL